MAQIIQVLSVCFQIPLLTDDELSALEKITDAEEIGCDDITAWLKFELDEGETVEDKRDQVEDFLSNRKEYTALIEQSCKC